MTGERLKSRGHNPGLKKKLSVWKWNQSYPDLPSACSWNGVEQGGNPPQSTRAEQWTLVTDLGIKHSILLAFWKNILADPDFATLNDVFQLVTEQNEGDPVKGRWEGRGCQNVAQALCSATAILR